jgi:hypothetical protein
MFGLGKAVHCFFIEIRCTHAHILPLIASSNLHVKAKFATGIRQTSAIMNSGALFRNFIRTNSLLCFCCANNGKLAVNEQCVGPRYYDFEDVCTRQSAA